MTRHKFHGSPERFDVLAEFIYDRFGNSIKYIADVAGGQGMLSRVLNKKYGYESEVVDPRGWTLKGVGSRAEEYQASMASYYDLIVGLHPDEATRPVVESGTERPVIVIPCCNFWDRSQKLGRDAMLDAISAYCDDNRIAYERVTFDFKGPKNIGLLIGAHS